MPISKDIFAAGVCIVNDGKVLATKRTDGKGYGFPCGKRDEGELAHHTAVRECFEETGYVAVVHVQEDVDNLKLQGTAVNTLKVFNSSYTGVDDSGHLIRIYRAESVAVGDPTHPEEGEVVWVTPKELIEESTWTEYNKSVFKHFGIKWESNDKPKTELEIERRWLVLNPPDFSISGDIWRELSITQMYLEGKYVERIRQTVEGDKTVYHHTIKKPAKKHGGVWETESEITADEFNKLMPRIDKSKQAVIKIRRVMTVGKIKYELDQFIHPIQAWILEVEIPTKDTKVELPEIIFGDTIEVTDERGLSNYKIAAHPNAAIKKIKSLLPKKAKSNKSTE
jgi:8-oxo-dGTP pyrophosphatase MutT (NUDIX family)